MLRFLAALLFVTTLCSAATPSPTAGAAPVSASMVGLWKGVAPDKATEVAYEFSNDGKVVWTVGNQAMRCKYAAKPKDSLILIDIFDFESPRMNGVRFLGIVQITGDTMKLFGAPSKDGKKRDGSPATYPTEFPGDALILTKSK